MDILLEICVTEITVETVESVEKALRELNEQSEAVGKSMETRKLVDLFAAHPISDGLDSP